MESVGHAAAAELRETQSRADARRAEARSRVLGLEEELAAAIDRLDYDAVEDLTRRIAESGLAYYAQRDLALFLRAIASRVIMRRVRREAGLTSSTRKQ